MCQHPFIRHDIYWDTNAVRHLDVAVGGLTFCLDCGEPLIAWFVSDPGIIIDINSWNKFLPSAVVEEHIKSGDFCHARELTTYEKARLILMGYKIEIDDETLKAWKESKEHKLRDLWSSK